MGRRSVQEQGVSASPMQSSHICVCSYAAHAAPSNSKAASTATMVGFPRFHYSKLTRPAALRWFRRQNLGLDLASRMARSGSILDVTETYKSNGQGHRKLIVTRCLSLLISGASFCGTAYGLNLCRDDRLVENGNGTERCCCATCRQTVMN